MQNLKVMKMDDKLFNQTKKFTVETDEKNPITIAVISDDYDITVKAGYRVRITPRNND